MNQKHRSAAFGHCGFDATCWKRRGAAPQEDLKHRLGSANTIGRRCTPSPAIAGSARKTLKTSSRASLRISSNGVPAERGPIKRAISLIVAHLLTSFQNFIAAEIRRARTEKRGGRVEVLPF
jgi:hypothetical protein